MVRVKMRTRYAGPRGCCDPGGELLVPKEEAEALIASGHAEPAKAPGVEAASTAPAENAAAKPARPRARK